MFSAENTNREDLLKQADLAMYQAKSAGRNTVRFFDPQMQALVRDRTAIEADLRKAIVPHRNFCFTTNRKSTNPAL